MRVVVVGAGAIGSIVGAHLTRAGHDVVFVARGDRLRAINVRGVEIGGLRSFRVDVAATDDTSALQRCDALIVATKTYATGAALETVANIECGLCCSLQNGTLKNALLAQAFGTDAVVGACTMLGGTLGGDGVVDFFLEEETFLGELDGTRSERVEELAAAFRGSELPVAVVDDVRSFEWTKQANHASAAPLSALTRLPMYLIWGDRRLAEVVVGIMRETVAVARALGIEPTDHPGFGYDIRAMADGPFEDAVDIVLARGCDLQERGMTNVRPSMSGDIEAGKPTEIEETVGHVVREAERLGVPVPLLTYSYSVVHAIDAAREAHAAAVAGVV